MPRDTDRPPPLTIAMQWASRVTSIAAEMVVPGLLGWWADGKLGTGFLFLLLGTGVGLTLGMVHLLQIAKQ